MGVTAAQRLGRCRLLAARWGIELGDDVLTSNVTEKTVEMVY